MEIQSNICHFCHIIWELPLVFRIKNLGTNIAIQKSSCDLLRSVHATLCVNILIVWWPKEKQHMWRTNKLRQFIQLWTKRTTIMSNLSETLRCLRETHCYLSVFIFCSCSFHLVTEWHMQSVRTLNSNSCPRFDCSTCYWYT